ncbi:AMIN-like domain-containing (lipo)protein [Actinoplanes sp. NPDC049316]|uniref:AMIN-like domain-containing (lipo)protein n=1 Tax=Actinoplanes sp. NPDC049316 TaxID=3154727 RepID=UPI003418412E
MRRISGRAVAALAAAAVLLSGCGGGGSPQTPASAPGPGPTVTTAAPTATESPAGTTAPTTKPSVPGGQGGASTPATTTHWTSGPVTVRHNPVVPPVPVLVGVRYAAHSKEGFDRIVFDLKGTGLPGYSVRYVSEVRGDPSDRPVRVPGRRFLLVVLNPAQAHRDDGTDTVSGSHRLDLPMMRGYAVAGDYEGYVSIAIGLDDVVGYRVGELPGRIYLDVAA